jgi:short-subunit dehydrogenase
MFYHFFCCLEGIGRATVKLLAKCGANIVALSRTRSDLDSLKTEVSSNKLHDALTKNIDHDLGTNLNCYFWQ